MKKNSQKKISDDRTTIVNTDNNNTHNNINIKNESNHQLTSIFPSQSQPPLHLSREDVKIARNLLKGILQSTENILVQSKENN